MDNFINSIISILQGNYTSLAGAMPLIFLIAGIILVILIIIFTVIIVKNNVKKK